MKVKYIAAVIFLIIFISISPIHAANQPLNKANADYIIGPGDVLSISVWNNQALTKLVTVMPDGKIHYPLIGQVMVSGKTIPILEKELNKKISKYIPNANLSVMIQEIKSMLIYVIGKVKSPGRFDMNRSINVLQALATAGGLDKFAKKDKIKIYRESNGKTEIYHFDYDEVMDGEKLGQNIRLERGDVVVVP